MNQVKVSYTFSYQATLSIQQHPPPLYPKLSIIVNHSEDL